MRDEDESLATQRLLNVIRGESSHLGTAKTDGPDQTSPAAQFPESSSLGDRVTLTRPLKPRSWFPNRSKVGLDIGHQAVKMVRLESVGQGFRLLQLGIADVVPQEETAEARVSAQAEAARSILKDIHLSKTFLITSVSDPGIIIRQTTLPRMSPKELAKTMPFEARKHIPYDPAQVTLRYQVFSQSRKSPTIQVLIVAISHEAIQRHREILDRLGIEPYAIEVGPLALVNAYLLGFHNPLETTVLLDIGASRTVIDIQRDGGIFFCRHLPISTAGFVREIQTRMGLSVKEIEEIKRGGTFSDEIDMKKMYNALQPGVDKLLMEIRRSLAFYDNVTGHLGFSRIFLSGGGALLPGLRESLEDNLDLPVQIMDPFEGIYWDEAKFPRGWMERTRPLWTVAVGLATRR